MNKESMLVTVLGVTILTTACGYHTTSGVRAAGTARVHISPVHKTNRTYADEVWLMQHEPSWVKQTWTQYGCPPVYYAGTYYFEPPGDPKTDVVDAITIPPIQNLSQPWPTWLDGPIPSTPHYRGGCL